MGDSFCSEFVIWLSSLEEQQEVPVVNGSTRCPGHTKSLGTALFGEV